MFDRICLWSHLVLYFCVLEVLKSVSISILVTSLFIFSISSWLSLGSLYLSKNLFISSRLSIFLPYIRPYSVLVVVFYDPLYFCGISCNSFFFSFLILLIWFLSCFFLMSRAKSLSILFIFSKNQLLVSLILTIVFFEMYTIFAMLFLNSCSTELSI